MLYRKTGFIVLFVFIVQNTYSLPTEIQERIQPIGQIRIKEPNKTAPNNKTSPVNNVPLDDVGKNKYTQHCALCHQGGLAGAPKFRDAQDWTIRLKERTLDQLLANAIQGVNAMPIKGTCTECSDQDLQAAIAYMLPKS